MKPVLNGLAKKAFDPNLNATNLVTKPVVHALNQLNSAGGSIGYSGNQKQLPEEFDFEGGCLIGVYGHVQDNIIRQIGYIYTTKHYDEATATYLEVVEETPLNSIEE